MTYQPIPPERKLTRRKLRVDPYYKTPTYGLFTPTGIKVAEVSNTSVAADDYPWSWVLEDGIASTAPNGRSAGTEESLKVAVDVISHLYRIKGQPIRTESRSKVGIEWFATEAEAEARVPSAVEHGRRKLAQGYDFGYLSIGREPAFDTDGLFAVVVP